MLPIAITHAKPYDCAQQVAAVNPCVIFCKSTNDSAVLSSSHFFKDLLKASAYAVFTAAKASKYEHLSATLIFM
jgi:hypothetical protein